MSFPCVFMVFVSLSMIGVGFFEYHSIISFEENRAVGSRGVGGRNLCKNRSSMISSRAESFLKSFQPLFYDNQQRLPQCLCLCCKIIKVIKSEGNQTRSTPIFEVVSSCGVIM